jgi:hypothetical protein
LLLTISCSPDKGESKSDSTGGVRSYTSDSILNRRTNELNRNPRKPISSGQNQTIYVFADDYVWDLSEPHLRESLERYFFTTENEQLFDVVRGDFDRFRQQQRFRNIIFISDLNRRGEVTDFVRKIMNEHAINNAIARNATMYMNDNLWANDQLVVFFLGNSVTNIENFLSTNSNTYFQLFYNRFIARNNFQAKRLKGYPDSFFTEMPFKVYIPETYKVFRRDRDNNFISFLWRALADQDRNPDKYIAIYWERVDENPLIDTDWLVRNRAMIGWNYYDEDELDPDTTMAGKKDFGDGEAHFISGRWQNAKYFMGGAFQTFGLYCEKQKIAYLIDTNVYFPAGYKLRYLLELESIVQTFEMK